MFGSLKRKFTRWQEAGLISEEQSAAILTFEKELKSGKLKNIAERSGRLQDGKHGLEELRREGYM